MNKFIGSLIMLFAMLVVNVEARILIGTNGNVVVDDLSLRMPTPQEVKAYENPGTVVPDYGESEFKRISFWYGQTFQKSTNGVVFKDGKMEDVGGEYQMKVRSRFLWYIPVSILGVLLVMIGNLIWWNLRMKVREIFVFAWVVTVVAMNAAAICGYYGAFLAILIAMVTTPLIDWSTARGSARFNFWSAVFYTAMVTAIFWGLW